MSCSAHTQWIQFKSSRRLGFLPNIVTQYGQVYFRSVAFVDKRVEWIPRLSLHHRSTNMPRTMESLHHIVHGLYPPSHFASGVTPRMFIRWGMPFHSARFQEAKANFAPFCTEMARMKTCLGIHLHVNALRSYFSGSHKVHTPSCNLIFRRRVLTWTLKKQNKTK